MDVKNIQVENERLLHQIKSGDPKLMQRLYNDQRGPFVTWAVQQYRCDEEDAVDIFQRSFTLLYLNIRNDKLTVLTSSLKTYLFSIGKNLFRETFRDKHRQTVTLEDNTEVREKLDTNILDEYHQSHQKEVVRKLLSRIGEPCKTLLELMFIHGYSTEAVVEEMGYSDERVVRKRKCLCLKKMREMLKEHEDLF